jgi:hypothetical protein
MSDHRSLGGINPPCSIEPNPRYADATAERTTRRTIADDSRW